jgi:ABC-type Fe3+ transport system substrate-binding protein
MRKLIATIVASVVVLPLAAAAQSQVSPALKDVIEGAKKEGRLVLQWPESLAGGAAARDIARAMNRAYGTNINVTYTPDNSSIPQHINKLMVTQQSGQPAPTDAFVGTTGHVLLLTQRQAVVPVSWGELLPGRVNERIVEADNHAVRLFTTLPGGIIYNTKTVPRKPTKLADLLEPEFKGKLATNPYAASFELLSGSDVWGEERARDFARKLSKQVSGIIGCPEIERIASGEFPAFAMDCSGRTWVKFNRDGAPVSMVVPQDFASQRYYYMMIPKNAANPNAAKLYVSFLLTPQGQQMLWKSDDTDLHLFPDSGMAKVVADYEKTGLKFREFTADWARAHPETGPAQVKAIQIITQR